MYDVHVFVIIPCFGKAAGFCVGFPAAALLCLILAISGSGMVCRRTATHSFLWL